MEVGTTIKKIRQVKNMTQVDLAKGILTRSHLSLIENNKYLPSYLVLSDLIHSLQVSIEEFTFIQNDYSLAFEQKIFTELAHAVKQKDLAFVRHTKKEALLTYEKNSNIIFYHIHLIAKAFLVYSENGYTYNTQLATIIAPIKEHLFAMDEWFLYELKLFIGIMYCLDYESITVANKYLHSFQRYENFIEGCQIYLTVMLKLSTYYIEQNFYQNSLNYTLLDKEILTLEPFLFEEILLDINQAIAEIKLGINPIRNKEILNNRLFLFDSLGYKDLNQQLLNLIAEIEIQLT